MDADERGKLLKVAKAAVKAAVCGVKFDVEMEGEGILGEKRGCFVTLKNGQELRGCIGQFTSEEALIKLVADMGKASAIGDSRFAGNRITEDELDELDIEISVLSPLERTDDPLSLRLGVDGIYIKQGRLAGCFLPQVAEETGWSKEEFLGYCCSHKAGLPPEAWRDRETEVYLFSAEVFGAKWGDI